MQVANPQRHAADTDTQTEINNRLLCLDTWFFPEHHLLSTCRTRAPAHPSWWRSYKLFQSLWPGRCTCSHVQPTCRPETKERRGIKVSFKGDILCKNPFFLLLGADIRASEVTSRWKTWSSSTLDWRNWATKRDQFQLSEPELQSREMEASEK